MADLTLPAPGAPAEEWGRLAVSLSGFTWTMPWASLPDEHGRVWRRNWCPRDSGFGWTQVCGLTDKGPRPTFEAIDPDDPGAEGCLFRLLMVGRSVTPHVDAFVLGRPDALPTLGRACVADAATHGRWPGGAP